MAKPTAPLLSFGASGQVAKTIVYSNWRGIPVARRYASPTYSNTTEQAEVRSIFRTLNQMWVRMPAEGRAPWDAYAQGKPLTGRNHFIGVNTRALYDTVPVTDMALFVASPGARGGPPAATIVPTETDTTVTLTLTAPSNIEGWTVAMAAGILFPDQDPSMSFQATILPDTVTPGPYALEWTGLTPALDYIAAAWLVWNRPDGALAYSVSQTFAIETDA